MGHAGRRGKSGLHLQETIMKYNPSNDLTRRAGLEPGENGHPVGRDPRGMSSRELKMTGHSPAPPLDAIRAHCVDCCAGQLGEVRRCTAIGCDLWPFRMGVNVWLPKPSLAQRRQRAAALERAAEAKNVRTPGQKISGTDPAIDDYPDLASAQESAPKPGVGRVP
jgi:hypothetical protein